MTQQLLAEPELLKVESGRSTRIGVDRETNVISGYVVAQKGQFKSEGRGQFTTESLEKLVELGNAKENGIRMRFGHPNQSDDGLGKYLGRSRNFRLEGEKVRADAHITDSALMEPPGGGRPLGDYVMHLAETDPGAFSSSIVVKAEKEAIEGQPPVWMPTELFASDVVDTGDAVDDFLSVDFLEGLPSGAVYQATKLIDKQFNGQPRDVVAARLQRFVNKYLDHQFGPQPEEEEDMSSSDNAATNARLEALETSVATISDSLTSVSESLCQLSVAIAEDREAAKEKLATEDRSAKITALCAMAKLSSDEATKYIADEQLSVNDVREILYKKMCEDRTPAGHDETDEESTEEVKLQKEYEANKDIHRKFGIRREEFISQLKTDDDAPEYMSARWADEYREKYMKANGIGA